MIPIGIVTYRASSSTTFLLRIGELSTINFTSSSSSKRERSSGSSESVRKSRGIARSWLSCFKLSRLKGGYMLIQQPFLGLSISISLESSLI